VSEVFENVWLCWGDGCLSRQGEELNITWSIEQERAAPEIVFLIFFEDVVSNLHFGFVACALVADDVANR